MGGGPPLENDGKDLEKKGLENDGKKDDGSWSFHMFNVDGLYIYEVIATAFLWLINFES